MKQKKQVPKRRFKGFKEKWEKIQFKEVLCVNSGRDYKHLNVGNIPVYGTGGLMLLVDDKLSDVDGIGIGRKGTIDRPQFLKAPFWTVDTLFFITPINNIDLYFMYSKSQEIDWKSMDESSGVPSLSKNTIEKVAFYLPSLKEQQKIGRLFKNLDEMINLQQRKIEKTKALKSAYLAEMFPAEGEHVPKRRFAGFTDEWKKVKFGDLLQAHPSKNYLANPNYQGEYEVIQQGDSSVIGYAKGNPFNNYEGVVLFGDHTLSLYKPKSPFFVATDGIKILSADETIGDFLFILLKRYKPEAEGYKRHFTILQNKYCMITKNKKEQQKIGLFFKKIDNTILNHQSKLDKLQATKQAYLHEMFV